MEKFAECISKCAGHLEQVVKIVATILLGLLISIVLFQVANRVLIGKSYVEIEELSLVLASWCAFFAIAYTIRKKAHVRIDVFTNKLPFIIKHTLMLAIDLIIFLTLIMLIRYGFLLAHRKMNVPMMVLPFDSGFWYMSFPVGMIFASFFMFDNMVQEILHLKNAKMNKYINYTR